MFSKDVAKHRTPRFPLFRGIRRTSYYLLAIFRVAALMGGGYGFENDDELH